jgi:hypothetical protein
VKGKKTDAALKCFTKYTDKIIGYERQVMKRIYATAAIAFMAGYLVNDVVQVLGLGVQPAQASVAGMNYRLLSRDPDFIEAVLQVVDGACRVNDGAETVYC